MPVGLRGSGDFSKQVFTRYNYGEVILFDPLGPATIYSVLRAPASEQGRALFGKEPVAVQTKAQIVDDLIAQRSLASATRCVEPFAQCLLA